MRIDDARRLVGDTSGCPLNWARAQLERLGYPSARGELVGLEPHPSGS
ncbi:MAG TPA: hypothetical protein VE780_03010 [Thermoleophilaceae bacterium]|nr:hypothetical protein [Thermoleophilaceae bacterium]